MPAFEMLADDPLPSPSLAAWLRGWWAGAVRDGWPATPRALTHHEESWWNIGACAGFTSRVAERRARRLSLPR